MYKCINIIIFYDNEDELTNYIIDAADKGTINNLEFAVVVNKDSNNIINNLKNKLTKLVDNKIYIYNFGENIGYLNALLYVVKKIDINNYKYIILSNTDIYYITKNFYDYLVKKNYENEIGCIAPSVFSSNTNTYSNPHYKTRIPLSKIQRTQRILLHPQLARFYIKLSELKARNMKKKELPSEYVYSPHGCFMVFTNSFIHKIAWDSYGAKMYSEESYVGEMLIQYNYKCFYDSNIKIIHKENTITSSIKNKKKYQYMSESLQYIINRFYLYKPQ